MAQLKVATFFFPTDVVNHQLLYTHKFLLMTGISIVVKCLGQQQLMIYHKNPKTLDTRENCGNVPKIRTTWFYRIVMHPKDTDRMANSVDPDQTAPVGAV